MSDALLAAMQDAAQAGGALALKARDGTLKSWDKGEDDPVSDADIAVDGLIRERLTGAFGDIGWHSEESGVDRGAADAPYWLVDPIDGTRAFIEGQSIWCIAIALIEQARPTRAVIFAPERGELYHAVAGGGGYRNGARLAPAAYKTLDGALIAGYARLFRSKSRWARPWPEPLSFDPIPSMLLRLAGIACGEFALGLTLKPVMDWDFAAGDLLVREAGGDFFRLDGEPVTYGGAANEGVVFTAPGVRSLAEPYLHGLKY